MKKPTVLLAILALPITALGQTTVSFDNLPDNAFENVGLPANYMGLTWSSEWAWTDGLLSCFGPCGFINGTVSSPNVAYNALAQDVSVSSTTPFAFESAFLTAAWNDGMHVDIYGYLRGAQTNYLQVVLNTESAQQIAFHWNNVDTVAFHSEADGSNAGYNGSGGVIVFDNLVFSSLVSCEISNEGPPGVSDVQLIINQALGVAQAVSDLDGDGVVNVVDVQIVVNAALGSGCSVSNGLLSQFTPSGRYRFPAGTYELPPVKRPSGVVPGPVYQLTDLGTLGGSSARAYGINNLGQVVGESSACSKGLCLIHHAFLWEPGRMIDLTPPESATMNSVAYSINDGGHVTGTYGQAGHGGEGFLYAAGVAAALNSVPLGTPIAINNADQIVGAMAAAGASSRTGAFVWRAGTMSDLGTLGGTVSEAHGINDGGQIAGSANLAGDSAAHAFLYSGSGLADLGTLGGANSAALGINRTGEVVGWSQIAGNEARHAFLYRGAAITDLGTLGGRDSQSDAINSTGQIVGWSQTASGAQHAFSWSSGRMADLNSLVSAGPGVVLTEATAINDAGQMVANGSDGRAYLITLVVERR